MAEEIPVAPAHHRPLPAPAPSSSISLRPHQAPPPPAVAPSRPAEGPARTNLDRPRHRLRSLVVGELGPLLGGESAPDDLPEVAAGSATVDGGDGAPAPTLSPSFGLSDLPLPPPPTELPPGFTPVLISDAPVVSTETAWVEVGGRRRPRPEKVPVPSPRKEAGLPPAFKRRTYGLCFRFLSPDHFVVDCHGPVRCLRCHHSGHRERDCEARFSARQESPLRSSSPPVPLCRPKDPPQEPRPDSRPPPALSDRLQRSWASVVAHQDAINLEATGGLGEAGTVAGTSADSLSMLQRLLEAQVVALSAELQAMFAARLEEVFLPLRDLVATVQGWTDQVSGLWQLMEAIGGKLALAVPLTPDKDEESASLVVSEDKEASAAVGASCSPTKGGVMVQHIVDPPEVVFAPTEILLQGMEEQHNIDEVVSADKGVKLTDVTLAVEEVPLELTPPGDSLSLKVFEPDISLGGNRVPLSQTSATLLDELLNNFSCTAPLSLLDAPIDLQVEGGSPWVGRRSGRLEKKNKDCTIPTAKRAEYRLAEAFGELPKDMISQKGSEEDVQEKMKPYLRLCKQPVSPTTRQAIRELVQVNVYLLSS